MSTLDALAQVVVTPAATIGLPQPLDPMVVAGAVVVVIAAIGGLFVQCMNAYSAFKDRREAASERKTTLERATRAASISESTDKKADQLITSTAQIHELTNSTNAALQRALDVANEKIAGLEKLLIQMTDSQTRAEAAKVAADLQVALLTPAPPPHNRRAGDR